MKMIYVPTCRECPKVDTSDLAVVRCMAQIRPPAPSQGVNITDSYGKEFSAGCPLQAIPEETLYVNGQLASGKIILINTCGECLFKSRSGYCLICSRPDSVTQTMRENNFGLPPNIMCDLNGIPQGCPLADYPA
jgi:hypothetical protein